MNRYLVAVRLGPTFCEWINVMYSNTDSIVRVNCFFTRSTVKFGRTAPVYGLVCIGSWATTAEDGDQGMGRVNPCDLCYGKEATAYAAYVTIIVSDEGQLPRVKEAVKTYEAVTGAKVNQEK